MTAITRACRRSAGVAPIEIALVSNPPCTEEPRPADGFSRMPTETLFNKKRLWLYFFGLQVPITQNIPIWQLCSSSSWQAWKLFPFVHERGYAIGSQPIKNGFLLPNNYCAMDNQSRSSKQVGFLLNMPLSYEELKESNLDKCGPWWTGILRYLFLLIMGFGWAEMCNEWNMHRAEWREHPQNYNKCIT